MEFNDFTYILPNLITTIRVAEVSVVGIDNQSSGYKLFHNLGVFHHQGNYSNKIIQVDITYVFYQPIRLMHTY